MLGLGKKKQDETTQEPLGTHAMVYSEYALSPAERIGCALGGFAAGFALGEVFYGIVVLSAILGVAGVFVAPKLYSGVMLKRRQRELTTQFRDMLEAVATAISAGENVTSAFTSAYSAMKQQYADNAYIVNELGAIVAGMNNNINVETLLKDFANRSGIDDIASFASVFDTAYRKGGNIKEVVQSTYEVMNEKIEVEMEIQTLVASSSNELNIMLGLPVIIILIMRFMGGAAMGQGTALSVVSTTVALAIIVASYALGRRMMRINV